MQAYAKLITRVYPLHDYGVGQGASGVGHGDSGLWIMVGVVLAVVLVDVLVVLWRNSSSANTWC